jgi:hypothetical protein
MDEKRRLLIGGVYQKTGRLKLASPLMVEICDEFEPFLKDNGYLSTAPFETVSLIYRFGEADIFDPDISNVNKAHSELPVAIAFNLERLKPMDRQQLRDEFRTATIEVLCDVAANFDLPYEFLDEMRASA